MVSPDLRVFTTGFSRFGSSYKSYAEAYEELIDYPPYFSFMQTGSWVELVRRLPGGNEGVSPD